MNYPVVLVLSSCPQTSALDVIANIRKIPNDDNIYEIEGSALYIHEINTKYYNTQIAFYPVKNTNDVSDVLKSNVEGFIIYFDSSDRNVLETVSQCVGFIKACQIEFCMMLCKQLSDDDKNGVSFKCIKDCYNMLDIIELEKSSCEDFEEEDLYNPSGYEELAQALRSVIWSNVDLNHVTPNGNSQPCESCDGSADNEDDLSNDELSVENELENFEKLLNQMMQFRPATNNMSREERLNSAQGIAEIFEKLIMQDEDLSNVNND